MTTTGTHVQSKSDGSSGLQAIVILLPVPFSATACVLAAAAGVELTGVHRVREKVRPVQPARRSVSTCYVWAKGRRESFVLLSHLSFEIISKYKI